MQRHFLLAAFILAAAITLWFAYAYSPRPTPPAHTGNTKKSYKAKFSIKSSTWSDWDHSVRPGKTVTISAAENETITLSGPEKKDLVYTIKISSIGESSATVSPEGDNLATTENGRSTYKKAQAQNVQVSQNVEWGTLSNDGGSSWKITLLEISSN
jgi:hypothetical protein